MTQLEANHIYFTEEPDDYPRPVKHRQDTPAWMGPLPDRLKTDEYYAMLEIEMPEGPMRD